MNQYRSAVNQPSAFSFNSDDDVLNPLSGTFSALRIQPPVPIIGADQVLLSKATIPHNLQIPDYALNFWYYRNGALKCLRLLPNQYATSDYASTFNGSQFNKRFTGVADFVATLNAMAARTSDLGNAYHPGIANDLTFNYDVAANTTYIRIIISGTGGGTSYKPARLDDPLVEAARVTMRVGTSGPYCPSVKGQHLNNRLGYTRTMQNTEYTAASSSTGIYPDGNFNFNYSNFIYVCSNLAAGNGWGPRGMQNVLACIPYDPNVNNLICYQATEDNMIRNVANDLYVLDVSLLDDNAQPILITDSTPASFQINFYYDK